MSPFMGTRQCLIKPRSQRKVPVQQGTTSNNGVVHKECTWNAVQTFAVVKHRSIINCRCRRIHMNLGSVLFLIFEEYILNQYDTDEVHKQCQNLRVGDTTGLKDILKRHCNETVRHAHAT
jgi:hypothetical protein